MKIDCTNCHGKGTHEGYDNRNYEDDTVYVKECWACNGSGKILKEKEHKDHSHDKK